MPERVYTRKEAAELLGVQASSLAGYISKKKITSSAQDANGSHAFTRADLEGYALSRGIALPPEPEEEPAQVPARIEEPASDESALLQNIIASAFAFMRQHGMLEGMLALMPADPDFRLWEFASPDGDLHILVRGAQITILAEGYLRKLEARTSELTERLKKAETNLAYLRKKPQEIVLDRYTRPVLAHLEPHQAGFLVTSPEFDVAAQGATEEEVIMHFRGALKGYCWYLRTHTVDVSPEQKAQFPSLRALFGGEEP